MRSLNQGGMNEASFPVTSTLHVIVKCFIHVRVEVRTKKNDGIFVCSMSKVVFPCQSITGSHGWTQLQHFLFTYTYHLIIFTLLIFH